MPKIVTSDRHRHYTKSVVAYLCCGVCFLHFCEAVEVWSCCVYGICLSAESTDRTGAVTVTVVDAM